MPPRVSSATLVKTRVVAPRDTAPAGPRAAVMYVTNRSEVAS
jgi:hypothetical protein